MNTIANKPAFGNIPGLIYVKPKKNDPDATNCFMQKMKKSDIGRPEGLNNNFLLENSDNAYMMTKRVIQATERTNKLLAPDKKIDPNKILAANAELIIDLNA